MFRVFISSVQDELVEDRCLLTQWLKTNLVALSRSGNAKCGRARSGCSDRC